jgi:hypothetical protein
MSFEIELKKCETLKQVFDVCNKYYRTEDALGVISGTLVKAKIPSLVKTLNVKSR